MKYEQTYPGLQPEIAETIGKMIPGTFTKSLTDAGVCFALPKDKPLELKVKYDVSEDGGSLTLKVIWDNEVDEEDEDEDEEDKEDD